MPTALCQAPQLHFVFHHTCTYSISEPRTSRLPACASCGMKKQASRFAEHFHASFLKPKVYYHGLLATNLAQLTCRLGSKRSESHVPSSQRLLEHPQLRDCPEKNRQLNIEEAAQILFEEGDEEWDGNESLKWNDNPSYRK